MSVAARGRAIFLSPSRLLPLQLCRIFSWNTSPVSSSIELSHVVMCLLCMMSVRILCSDIPHDPLVRGRWHIVPNFGSTIKR